MINKFTVVMPIHNEEKFLLYSLPSVFELEPSEVVLLFDRCTDNSYDLALDYVYYYGYEERTKFLRFPEKRWRFQLAFLRRWGYRLATYNKILATSADIILHSKILEGLDLLKDDVALVGLGCLDYPVSPRNLVGNLAQKVMFRMGYPRFYGPFFFRKDLWVQSFEGVEAVHREAVSEDAPLWLALLQKYRMAFIPSRCLHLRADESWERNYWRGRDYWRVARRGWFFALASSVAMMRPSLMAGYIHERLKC